MDEVNYKKFFENSVDMFCTAGFDGYLKVINQAFYHTLGYSEEELLSKPFVSFIHPDDVASTQNEVERLATGVRTVKFDNRYQHYDGHYLWIGWSAYPDLQNKRIYAIARNITDQKQMAANLIGLSHTDPNTSIPNRRAFDNRFQNEWNRAKRHNYPISIVTIDIDHFKLYNDHYGHQMGDDCLRAIAQCLNSHLSRSHSFLARTGGDEFSVILPHEGLDEASVAAEYLRNAVESLQQPHKFNKDRNCVTITLGVSTTIPSAAGNIENFIAVADKSLYEAKRAGRNCFRGHYMDHSSTK